MESDEGRDSRSGSAWTPPRDQSGMAPSILLLIILCSVVVVALCVAIVAWKVCNCRDRRQRRRAVSRRCRGLSENFSTSSIRLRAMNTVELDSPASGRDLSFRDEIEDMVEMEKLYLRNEKMRRKNETVTGNIETGAEESCFGATARSIHGVTSARSNSNGNYPDFFSKFGKEAKVLKVPLGRQVNGIHEASQKRDRIDLNRRVAIAHETMQDLSYLGAAVLVPEDDELFEEKPGSKAGLALVDSADGISSSSSDFDSDANFAKLLAKMSGATTGPGSQFPPCEICRLAAEFNGELP